MNINDRMTHQLHSRPQALKTAKKELITTSFMKNKEIQRAPKTVAKKLIATQSYHEPPEKKTF